MLVAHQLLPTLLANGIYIGGGVLLVLLIVIIAFLLLRRGRTI